MKKVLVLGIQNLNNMGDNMIAEATEFLVRKACPDADIVHKELFLRPRYERGLKKWFLLMCSGFRMVFEKYRLYPLTDLFFRLPHQPYYNELISGFDAVIMTAGMLKYSTQCHS